MAVLCPLTSISRRHWHPTIKSTAESSVRHRHVAPPGVADCRSMLHQLIEPKPELRIPLLELELHPWLTSSGRLPFIPYHAPPRSKQLRGEVSWRGRGSQLVASCFYVHQLLFFTARSFFRMSIGNGKNGSENRPPYRFRKAAGSDYIYQLLFFCCEVIFQNIQWTWKKKKNRDIVFQKV